MKKRKKFSEELNLLQTNIKTFNNKIKYDNLSADLSYDNIYSNSWFDINIAKYKSGANYNYNNNDEKIEKIIKCKQIKLLPTEDQKNKLLLWLEYVRKIYNDTISMIKQLKKENNKKYINWQYIRTHKLKDIKQKYINKSNIHSHTLDKSIKLACSNYKSALTNLKNKNIKHFTVRYIKATKKIKVLELEKTCFSLEGFCIKQLGKVMKNADNYNYKNIKCDSKLIYKSQIDEFYLLISYYEKTKQQLAASNKVISIDPGQKIFLTGITQSNIYKIGTNLTDTIENKLNRIDHLNKINNKKSKRLVYIIYKKIKNQITDLHWKSINYLLTDINIGCIIVGNWSTKDSISKDQHLKTNNKRIINSISYYKFLQRLKFKCMEYNVPLIITEEAYTSKICCKCGSENTKCSNRIISCKNCNNTINRDINGALNILFKNL